MAGNNVSITVSMKPSDFATLKRIQTELAKKEGGVPTFSALMRRGIMLLARATGVKS